MSFDAVVIGAGHNGLVAANLLADAGWRVVVLEAATEPGGAVRSAQITAPGYLSDLCSAFYPLAVASPVLRALRLDEFGLSWRHAPEVLAHVFPDGRVATLSRDIRRTTASVEELVAGDAARWLAAYAEWKTISPHLVAAVLRSFPPVRAGLGLYRALRMPGALRLARRMVLPVSQLGEELFRGEGARLLLAGCATHTDLTPLHAGSGVYGWLLAMLGQETGWPVPSGGAGRITEAVTARLARRGGQIVTGVTVDRVEVRHGRAVAVRDAGGQSWKAGRAVL